MKQEKTAVLLIDMQEYFVRQLPKEERERIVPNQIGVLRRCARETIPLFVIEYWLPSTIDRSFGSVISELEAEIAFVKKEKIKRIQKYNDSAFYRTGLRIILKKMGVTRLFLMGINSGCCVKDTAIDALDAGFSVITSKTVISDSFPTRRKRSFEWYEQNVIFDFATTIF